jgi:hypothetical protein
MRLASATNQNGHLMARTTPAGESWNAWLQPHMAAKGWHRQSQLMKAFADAGHPVARQTVSKWFKRENAADPDLAAVAADIFGAPRAGALRAIGLEVIPAGMERPESLEPTGPADAQIERIMADESRSLERRLAMVRKYQQRSARIVDYMMEDADLDGDEPREPEDQAGTG